MGHQTTYVLPDTARWRSVVGLIAEDADVAAVAAATTQAAVDGLDQARGDPGVGAAVFLLTQVVLAARQPHFADALRDAGLRVGDEPGAVELAAAFGEALDRRLRTLGRTDLGEMCRLTAIESLAASLQGRAASLYDAAPDDVARAAYGFSTKAGFRSLAHDFLSRFAQRFLTYHLGRELGLHVGGSGVFAGPDDRRRFEERLAVHCREAAAIAKKFAGDWYSRNNFQGGIDEAAARGFAAHCMEKLRDELTIRGARDE